MWRRWLQRPEVALTATFAVLVLLGTAALLMPQARATDHGDWIDALFTATSAVCVTGLTTLDTSSDFTRTGQVCILVLIQLGGLGIMTFASLTSLLLGSGMSLRSHAALTDSFFQGELRGTLAGALKRILAITLSIEAAGMLALLLLLPRTEAGGGWFEAMFLAVSAFCNAGFSVYSDNAVSIGRSAGVLLTLMVLIVAGGLGYRVLIEVGSRARRRIKRLRTAPVNWTLNSAVVLRTSAALIVFGMVALAFTGVSSEQQSIPARILHALFQSVSARTAGFNSVDIGALPVTSLMILVFLMFVGGSPGSCAGGIKTTSFAVWMAGVWAQMTGRTSATLLYRRLPEDVLRRAAQVLALAVLWNGAGVFILSLSEPIGPGLRLEQLIFEQVSAFGTVGLSSGITPRLSAAGKLWIIATMFVGRVGPLTLTLAVLASAGRARFEYPYERVMIG